MHGQGDVQQVAAPTHTTVRVCKTKGVTSSQHAVPLETGFNLATPSVGIIFFNLTLVVITTRFFYFIPYLPIYVYLLI